jgi:DNA-binding transcriptional MerR regulator
LTKSSKNDINFEIITMEEKNNLYFTSSHIEAIFGINRKVLLYWRKIGILTPDLSRKSQGGHYRYSFTDLVAIKTIVRLNDAGASTYRIKKAVEEFKKEFPEVKSPLSEKSFYVIGNIPYVIEGSRDYNPVTRQYSLIKTEETKSLVRSLTLSKFDIPDKALRVRASRR